MYEQSHWHYYEAHNISQCLRLLTLATQCHVQVLGYQFCAVLMYFQLGSVQMYTDFCAWRNNYGILATNVNPGTITAGDNQPQCTAKAIACSQRLT